MTIYQLVDKYNFIKKIVTTGGIKLKWSFLISGLILIVISIFLVVFFFIGREMLLRANDRLCKSLANSISATEGVITAEKKEFKRSLILQDMLQSISSGVDGLVYATIYDLSGSLGGKMKYSAHTNIKKQGTWIYKKLFNEIKNITEFEKKKIIIDAVKCFQYRVPFKFFKGSKSETTVGLVEIVFTEESVTGIIRWLLLFIATLEGLNLIICWIIYERNLNCQNTFHQ